MLRSIALLTQMGYAIAIWHVETYRRETGKGDRLISTNDVSEIYLDYLTTDFIGKIVNVIIPLMSEEYTEQLSDGARKILGL